MKVKELRKLLEGISPDAEITCNMTTDDYTYSSNITILDLKVLKLITYMMF